MNLGVGREAVVDVATGVAHAGDRTEWSKSLSSNYSNLCLFSYFIQSANIINVVDAIFRMLADLP